MRFILLIVTSGFLLAQPPVKSTLENTGKPMRVTVQCKGEDVLVLGLTCSQDDPCPLFLELSDVKQVNNRLVVSGNLHTATATLESILLSSDDLGKTWTEPFERLSGAGLDNLRFIDFESGWVSGQLQHTFPRDPFLLMTTDGGKTWRKQAISGEPRVGTIEQFHFESKTAGSLLLDKIQSGENGMRHELYETMNGGESWSLRQVSNKAIPWKYPKEPTGEWRLRADAATKSYKVERRQGERWQSVASFLVSAGECKPEEKPNEPPPTAEEPAPKTPEAPRKTPTLKKKP
jgi:hypothetical protein